MERSRYIRNGKGFNKKISFLISQLNTNTQQKIKTFKKWCMWQNRFKK